MSGRQKAMKSKIERPFNIFYLLPFSWCHIWKGNRGSLRNQTAFGSLSFRITLWIIFPSRVRLVAWAADQSRSAFWLTWHCSSTPSLEKSGWGKKSRLWLHGNHKLDRVTVTTWASEESLERYIATILAETLYPKPERFPAVTVIAQEQQNNRLGQAGRTSACGFKSVAKDLVWAIIISSCHFQIACTGNVGNVEMLWESMLIKMLQRLAYLTQQVTVLPGFDSVLYTAVFWHWEVTQILGRWAEL